MKYLVFFLLALLVVTNAVWIFYLLDRGVTLDHSRSAIADTERSLSILLKLSKSSLTGKGYQSILENIEINIEDSLIKTRPNAIFIDSVILVFEEGLFVEIKLLNEISSEEYDRLNM